MNSKPTTGKKIQALGELSDSSFSYACGRQNEFFVLLAPGYQVSVPSSAVAYPMEWCERQAEGGLSGRLKPKSMTID